MKILILSHRLPAKVVQGLKKQGHVITRIMALVPGDKTRFDQFDHILLDVKVMSQDAQEGVQVLQGSKLMQQLIRLGIPAKRITLLTLLEDPIIVADDASLVIIDLKHPADTLASILAEITPEKEVKP